MQNNPEKKPVMKQKMIYGYNFSEFELFSIRMISDYLFLDRFNDYASFVRFEQCFGPLFSKKNKDFKLVEAFKEIVGPKKKYITFKRMIKAYIDWKLKKSNNYSFNFFMSEIFQKMIKKRGEVVGKLEEGQRVFSTKNCRNRRIITKFSVLTDETKNKIKGFVIQYDTVFKAILCKQEKPDDIKLEINFDLFHSTGDKLSKEFQLDRDGISHIAGKYDETSGIIKFLIFKCRSGKTLYIGDSSESDAENITPFIFGSSKCQLKYLIIEIINDQLAYIQPKYQLSTRKNENLDINIDNLDEKYLEDNPTKFEEDELKNQPDEFFKDPKNYLMPLIPDDQFVDKMSLMESIGGKNFKEVYTSLFDKEEKNALDKFKDNIKRLINETLNKEKREEQLENEKTILRDSYYKKSDFESCFVNLIKMKKKEVKNKKEEDDDDSIEQIDDGEDEEGLKLVKIQSGVYQVQKQNMPLKSAKNEKVPKEKEDNLNQNLETNKYNNHKVVEIKETRKKPKEENNEKNQK